MSLGLSLRHRHCKNSANLIQFSKGGVFGINFFCFSKGGVFGKKKFNFQRGEYLEKIVDIFFGFEFLLNFSNFSNLFS
jgi:hypothetical protein